MFTGLWRDVRHERRETLPPGFAVVARWSVDLWELADRAGEGACGGNMRDVRPENRGWLLSIPVRSVLQTLPSVSRPVGIKLLRC